YTRSGRARPRASATSAPTSSRSSPASTPPPSCAHRSSATVSSSARSQAGRRSPARRSGWSRATSAPPAPHPPTDRPTACGPHSHARVTPLEGRRRNEMAVRLGVSFDKEDARDWETVERLAGAPKGTWPQADKLGRKIDELREQDRHDEADRLYRAECHTPVGKLYRFTVFGFDRLTENARR